MLILGRIKNSSCIALFSMKKTLINWSNELEIEVYQCLEQNRF